MDDASVQGALERQAPALAILDSGWQVRVMIILFHPRSTKPKNRRLPLSVLYLAAVLEARPAHGTVDLHSDGSFTYMPAPDYSGLDTFVYHASDGTANSRSITASLSPSNFSLSR